MSKLRHSLTNKYASAGETFMFRPPTGAFDTGVAVGDFRP